MRIYSGWAEAIGEIKRDLKEMGIAVHTKTVQDKVIEGDPSMNTFELQNYIYTVTDPLATLGELNPSQPWADRELVERLSGVPFNPGEAWKHRREVWEPYLHEGRFSYTYPERMSNHLKFITDGLERDQNSRQIFLPIFSHEDVRYIGGKTRIPCSIGYYFQFRQGKLNITYLQRSADFALHFVNDVWLATKLMEDTAKWTDMSPGMFTHWVGSLHVFAKDVAGVF